MDVARINTILVDCIGKTDDNRQPVEGSVLFDFFAMMVAIKTAEVHKYEAEMIELLSDWPSESLGMPVPPLGEEIDYLTVGSILGDQACAFLLFAFGEVAEWWEILDPHTVLGMSYDNLFARGMVAMGMVAIKGYKPAMSM